MASFSNGSRPSALSSTEAARAAELAFEALVHRHGAMVWGVCRRVLGNAHEAEDAFQATFLLLIRKAQSLRLDGSLGGWFYGVAHRIALRARSQARQRASIRAGSPVKAADDPAGEFERHDLHEILGDEVDRLPLKYRCPIELCYLQGMTYEQAARKLDWPVATIKSRLTRGRLRLRNRLARRGLAPFAAGMAAALGENSRAAVPTALANSIVHASASRAAGVFPAAVIELTERTLQIMMWQKLKMGALAIALVVVTGASVAATAMAERTDGNRSSETQQAGNDVQGFRPADGPTGPDPRWMRTLTSGATIEVLGVSPHPSGPNTWWRPDGTPLPEAPCDPFQANIGAGGDVVLRAVAVRVLHSPPGADLKWHVTEGNGGSSGPAKSGGKPAAGLSEVISVFARALKICTIRFEVASGDWKTVQTWAGSSGGGAVGSLNGSFIFGAPIATKKGTTWSVTHDLRDVDVRLVAVDKNGEEQPSTFRSGAGVKDFVQTTVEFPLPPERIREFRIQTRPYEVIEIPGVALVPKKGE